MSACPNCGAIPRPSDRFCNTCGRPVLPQQGQPPAPAPYGAPPPPANPPQGYSPAAAPPPPWGGPPAGSARCQQGHEIAAGQNYCAQGHPIALEGVQFAGNSQPYAVDPRAQPGPAYGAQPEYAPPVPAPAYPAHPGAPQPAYPFAPPPQAYAPAPYAPQAPQAPYAPPVQPVYAPPPAAQPPPAFKPSSPSGDEAGAAPAPAQARVLRGFLVSFQNNPQGDFWPLYSGRLTVGRSNSGEALDVPLADATISSRHAILAIDAAGPIQVEDTGSTNGTFVNDEHLGFNGRRELRDADRIRFGGFTATIKILARS